MAGYLGQKPAVNGIYTVDELTSSGGNTYTLSRAPGSKNNIQVSAGGLVQYPSAYSVSGTTLTLSGVPSGQKVIIRHMGETILYPNLDDNIVTAAKLATSGTMPAWNGSALTNLPAHSGNVQFPGSQVVSANANNLDDYQEGSWTPNLTDGSNNATHAGNNIGEYIKIGRAVFISCTLSTSGIGSVSGTIKCSGLPFTVKSGNLGFAVYCGSGGGMALSASVNMSGNFNGNTTDLAIYTWDVTTGTSAMQHSEWGGGNTQMTFAGHYFTAS